MISMTLSPNYYARLGGSGVAKYSLLPSIFIESLGSSLSCLCGGDGVGNFQYHGGELDKLVSLVGSSLAAILAKALTISCGTSF